MPGLLNLSCKLKEITGSPITVWGRGKRTLPKRYPRLGKSGNKIRFKAGKYCKAQETNGGYQASPGTRGEGFIEIPGFFLAEDGEIKSPFYVVVS